MEDTNDLTFESPSRQCFLNDFAVTCKILNKKQWKINNFVDQLTEYYKNMQENQCFFANLDRNMGPQMKPSSPNGARNGPLIEPPGPK